MYYRHEETEVRSVSVLWSFMERVLFGGEAMVYIGRPAGMQDLCKERGWWGVEAPGIWFVLASFIYLESYGKRVSVRDCFGLAHGYVCGVLS